MAARPGPAPAGPPPLFTQPYIRHHEALIQEGEEIPGICKVEPVRDVSLRVAVRCGVIRVEIEGEHTQEGEALRCDGEV